MRLLLYKRAYKRLAIHGQPFRDEEAGSLLEAVHLAFVHAGAAAREGRRITAVVASGDDGRFQIVSRGDGTTALWATDDTIAVLDEHWPDWKDDP